MSDMKSWDISLYPVRYLFLAGITDVAVIITNLRTELVTNLGWTEPVANSFRSPANSVGQYMTLACTAPTTKRLTTSVSDNNGLVICNREVQLNDPAATDVSILTGISHVVIFTHRVTPEGFIAFVGEAFPEKQENLTYPVFGGGYRSSGGVADGLFPYGSCFGVDSYATAYQSQRLYLPRLAQNVAGSTISPAMPSGRVLFEPAVAIQADGLGTSRRCCYAPQFAIGNSTIASYQISTVPVDLSGGTGQFWAAPWSDANFRLFVRYS